MELDTVPARGDRTGFTFKMSSRELLKKHLRFVFEKYIQFLTNVKAVEKDHPNYVRADKRVS